MKNLEAVEAEIRKLLESETSAVMLSNKLFAPGGLFTRLAATEAQRHVLTEIPLFQRAQDRLNMLQRKEAVRLSHETSRH